MLSPFECLCGNFILPEPASYVFFYAIFNLRKLFYLIELQSANLDFIRSVLQNWREYLSKAEHEIQAQIGKSPEKFGLQRAPFPETEIPAEQPQFLFYDETEWGLHFEICTLPVGEPFGLMVEFSGDTPTDVYGLSEAEEIEADME